MELTKYDTNAENKIQEDKALYAYRQDIEEFTEPSGNVAEALNMPLQVILARELLCFRKMIHTLPCVQLCPRNLPTYRNMSSTTCSIVGLQCFIKGNKVIYF